MPIDIHVVILNSNEVCSDLARRLHSVGYQPLLVPVSEGATVPNGNKTDVLLLPDDCLISPTRTEGMVAMLTTQYPNAELVLFRAQNGSSPPIGPCPQIVYRSLTYPPDHDEIASLISHALRYKVLKEQSLANLAIERLMATSAVLHDQGNLEHVLKCILQGVHSLGFDRVRLYLFSEDNNCIVGKDHIGMEGTNPPFIGLTLKIESDPYLRTMLETQKPQIFHRGQLSPGVPYEAELDKVDVVEWLCAPLISQGKTIGKLSADNKLSRKPLQQHFLRPVALFAGQAAAAIEHARLFKTIERKATELEALRNTTLAISSERDLDRLLKVIIREAVELLQAKGGGIYKLLPENRELKIVAGYGASEQLIGTRIKLEEGAAGYLLSSGESFLIIEDYKTWTRRASTFESSSPFCSVIAVPLRWKGDAIGVLYIDDATTRIFNSDEALLLKSFADQAAAALVNAELSENEARKLLRVEHFARASSDMVRNPAMPVEEKLELIARYATEIMVAETCGIFLAKNPRILSLEASYGHRPGSFVKGRQFEVRTGYRTGLTGYIAAQREVFRKSSQELRDHIAVNGSESAHTPSGHCFSLLAIPLLRIRSEREELIGLIRVDNKRGMDGLPNGETSFTKEDEWVFRLFADSVLVTLDNIDLISRLNAQNDHWRRLVSSAPTCVLSIDRKGRITGCNEQAANLLRFTEGELKERTVYDLYSDPDEAGRIGRKLDECEDGRLKSHETFLHDKQRTPIPIRLAATWLFDGKGVRVGSVGYFEDLREERKVEEHLTLLLEASNTVARAKDLSIGLERVLQMLVSRLSVTFGRVFLTDHTELSLTTEAAFPRDASLSWQPCLKASTAISDWPGLATFLQHGRTIILRADSDKEVLREWSRRLRLQSTIQWLLVVPLRVGERLIGLLDLAELRPWEERQLSEDEKKLVLAVADQTSALIDRIRLQHETERASQRLRSLYQASNALVSSQSPQDTIHLIVEEARKAANAVGASMILIDEMAEVRKMITAGDDQEAISPDLIRPAGLSMRIMSSRRPEVIGDITKDNRVNPSAFSRGIQAALGLPILLVGDPIGVMWFHYREKMDFPNTETQALQLYVNQAATAYDSARAMTELEHLRQAAEALSKAAKVEDVLQQVVRSACKVLEADSAVIWDIDPLQEDFALETCSAYGAPREAWEEMRGNGGWIQAVVRHTIAAGYLGVRDSTAGTSESLRIPAENSALPIRSFQGIALRSEEEVLGALIITYLRPRAFTRREREIAESLANHAALALKKAKLLDHLTRARDAAKTVADATLSENLEITLGHSVERIRDALACNAVTIFTYSDQRDEINFPPILTGLPDIPGLDRDAVLHDSFLRRSLSSTGLIMTEGRPEGSKAVNAILEAGSFLSYGAIPLNAGGHCVGILLLGFKRSRRVSPNEQTNLGLLASQAAVAIRNRQLFNREKRRSRALLALYKGVGAIMGTLSVAEMFEEITSQAYALVDPIGGHVHCSYLAEIEDGILRITHAHPKELITELAALFETGVDLKSPLSRKGISGRVAISGKSCLCNDVRLHGDYVPYLSQTRSQLSVPIMIDDNVRGVISVERTTINGFESLDLHTLEALAAFAAKYQQLSETKMLLGAQTALAWTGLESSTLFHEIKTKARTIKGHVEELARASSEASYIQERHRLAAVDGLANDIIDSRRLKPLGSLRESVDVDDLIRSRTAQRWNTLPFRDIQLALALSLTPRDRVKSDPEWLQRVFDILFDNAAEALKTSIDKKILITTTATGTGRVVICVTDSGPGVAPEVRNHIFKSFVRPEERGGRGKGLLIAQAIVHRYGGDIRLAPSTGGGATFVVRFPRESDTRQEVTEG